MNTKDTTKTSDKNELSSNFQYQQITICGNKYLVGVCKVNDFRQILVTDLLNFYEEKLSKEDCMKRIEDLNPLLSDCDFDEIIDDLLLNISKYMTSCTLECIELENQIEDGRLWFHVKLTKTDPQPYLDTFTENFYISFSELHYRYNYLLDLVKKKDREIEEYKAQGVKIVKKSLMTEPFSETLFETKRKQMEPLEKMAAFSETMNFYNSIRRLEKDEDVKKHESPLAGPEISNSITQIPSLKKKGTLKRPSSSNIRYASIPKTGKKAKQSKRNLIFKYI